MPKNKRELKVGDYVRISRTAKELYAATVFGNVGVIVVDNCDGRYVVSALCEYKKGTDFKCLWSLQEKHLKYAKQANKKARILEKAAKAGVFKPGQLVWVGDSGLSAFSNEIVEFVREGGWGGCGNSYSMVRPVGCTTDYMQSVQVKHLHQPTKAQLSTYKAKQVL